MSAVETGANHGLEVFQKPIPSLSEVLSPDEIIRIQNELVEIGFYSSVEEIPSFRDPLHTHEESGAFYPLEDDRGDEIIYVQIMFPNSRTSEHRHNPPVEEDYYVSRGKLYFNEMLLPQKTIFTVVSDLRHVATTKDCFPFTLTFLRTRNARGIPRDQLHVREQ